MRLEGAAIPCGPILDYAEAFDQPQARAREMALDVEHPVLGPPVQRWRRERILPLRVKAIAVGSMLASMGWVTFSLRPPWYLLAAMAAVVAVAVTFLARIPSRPKRTP